MHYRPSRHEQFSIKDLGCMSFNFVELDVSELYTADKLSRTVSFFFLNENIFYGILYYICNISLFNEAIT